MKKNLISSLALWMIVAVILSACSAAPTSSPAPSVAEPAETEAAATTAPETAPTVEISFWHTYNEDGAENDTLVNTLIPAFEAEHPNIKVNAISVPYDSFRKKLLAALVAGTAPDLIRSDIIWVPELAEMGALAALDAVMPDFSEYKDMVFAGPLSTNFWKDHYYGLPLDTNTKVWLYNDAVYAAQPGSKTRQLHLSNWKLTARRLRQSTRMLTSMPAMACIPG